MHEPVQFQTWPVCAQMWKAMANAASTLDVLSAFATFGACADGPTCMPAFVQPTARAAVFDAEGMWHPALALALGTSPVGSTLQLGSAGGASNAMALLLTGPNMVRSAAACDDHGVRFALLMVLSSSGRPCGHDATCVQARVQGGKSTLLRTTCVAAILAQMGCPVPAMRLTLSPVDAVYTRIGATDRIISGESTFMVECAECAAILDRATRDSLVIFDELGRGTSTFDGYAIAHAVLDHMVAGSRGRVLFATHYHPLNVEFSAHPGVQLGHMGARCAVTGLNPCIWLLMSIFRLWCSNCCQNIVVFLGYASSKFSAPRGDH